VSFVTVNCAPQDVPGCIASAIAAVGIRPYHSPSEIGEEVLAREQRRLAAIVAADVVGYSRLMGRDESGTLAALRALRREVVDPKIDAHGGRIVKTTGDGLLLEFPSVVDAVLAGRPCAADRGVQRDHPSVDFG
jgi:class 3 adenylate cyclase